MHITVNHNNKELGVACSPGEGKLLVMRAKAAGASEVELHGYAPQFPLSPENVNGYFTVAAAMALFCDAEQHQNEARKKHFEWMRQTSE
jgi:hypothetical protein